MIAALFCWGCSQSVSQPTTEQPVTTTQEPVKKKAEAERGSAYERALAAAEEAKARIEFDEGRESPSWRQPALGWVDLKGNGQKSRFEASYAANSSWASRDLVLISPDKPDICLELWWSSVDTYAGPHEYYFTNNGREEKGDDPLFEAEREFLETIKYAYDYISDEDIVSQAHDPQYAAHLWGRDNGKVKEGPMALRRYKGPLEWLDDAEHRVDDGPITYAAEGGWGGVWAYDRQADEHFLVFHGDWKNKRSITGLAKVDSWLLISTWGEGVVAVDPKDHYLKRLDAKATGQEPPEHDELEVTDSGIIIWRWEVERPIRRTGERLRPYRWGPYWYK